MPDSTAASPLRVDAPSGAAPRSGADDGVAGTAAVLRALRDLAAVVTAFTALLALVALLLGGTDVVALVFVPLVFVVAALTRPDILLLLLLVLVTLLVLVSATATLGAVLRAPLLALAQRLAASAAGGATPGPTPPLSPEAALRRRSVAGDLTYLEFRDGMVALLRERCARGELALADYEAALDDLLRPARHLDVGRDPDLAAAPHRPSRGAGARR